MGQAEAGLKGNLQTSAVGPEESGEEVSRKKGSTEDGDAVSQLDVYRDGKLPG
jgi:hypothetical protein